jgi:hypothetical protein
MSIIHFTLNLLGSFLLALGAVWAIRVRQRFPDHPLLFVVFACGGIAISFETLSYIRQLKFASIRFAILASFVVAIVAVRFMRWNAAADVMNDFFVVRETTAQHPLGASSKDQARRLEAGVSIILLAVLWATAFIALSCVPNNWDSMTYHLPRIEHWLQNRSLDYYPTSIDRQLDLNPFAEELILALRSIIDAYPLANMIQWLSFAGCIMVIGAICRQLGGSRKAQTLAHALGSTLPIAILEASLSSSEKMPPPPQRANASRQTHAQDQAPQLCRRDVRSLTPNFHRDRHSSRQKQNTPTGCSLAELSVRAPYPDGRNRRKPLAAPLTSADLPTQRDSRAAIRGTHRVCPPAL